MRNTLRYGLASIIVAGAGLSATLVACGDDEEPGSSSGNVTEAGSTDQLAPETSTGETGTDAAKPNAAKLTLVNATTDMGPSTILNGRGDAAIRVCFKQGTTDANISVAPYPPLPDKASAAAPPGTPPGIFYGTGGTFPSFGLDLQDRIIVPIVMNARSLFQKGIINPGNGQPGTTCDELVGATADASAGLVANQDYWELPAIPAQTFLQEKAYVLVLTGCVGDATIANKDKCGANPPAGGTPGLGNLAVKVFETARTPVAATQLGAQFLNGSTQANALFTPAGFAVEPGFMANPADQTTFKAAAPDGGVAVLTLTPAQGVTGVTATDFFVTSPKTFNGLRPGPTAPFPLATIQAISALPPPSIFTDGKNFVFISVGDLEQPTFKGADGGCTLPEEVGCGDGGDGTSFNTRSYHYLAFPTDPTILPYTP